MDIRQLYDYYAFGFNYRMMIDGYSGHSVKSAVEGIDLFLLKIIQFDLKVTKHAVGDDLTKILDELKNLTQTEKMAEPNISKLKNYTKSIDKTLDAEMQLNNAYILTEKRLGLEKLTDDIGLLFGDDIFDALPDICKSDFGEAGYCIAFERHTAAAFHILRATEEMLRAYYKHTVRRNRIKKLLWYNITQDLKGKRGVPDSLLAVLDGIREDFRNPTAHPEKRYSSNEAQTLFSHCVDVVGRMVNNMDKNKSKK